MLKIDPLPTLRELTAMLRNLNLSLSQGDAGGEFFQLVHCEADWPYPGGWRLTCAAQHEAYVDMIVAQREFVPADCTACVVVATAAPNPGLECEGEPTLDLRTITRFDAVAAARRILASARDAGLK